MKQQACPTDEKPNRTWCDRFIKLTGSYNDRAPKIYCDNLMGDSPELMSLDNHLFADVEEAVARNIAFSFHFPEGHQDKYSASTPNRMYASIERTINSGKVQTQERIVQDMKRIVDETLDRIINAKGCYIEDSIVGKKSRKGNRGRVQAAFWQEQREKLLLVDDKLVDAMVSLHADVVSKKVEDPVKFEIYVEPKVESDNDDSVCSELGFHDLEYVSDKGSGDEGDHERDSV